MSWVLWLSACRQDLQGTAGCRQTLWEICIGLWSRPVWLPQPTTDQPAAWSTSDRSSVESTTRCLMTNSIAFGSSTAHLRYHDMFRASHGRHKRVSLLDHYSAPVLCFFPTECPLSRHKPLFGFSRLRGRSVDTNSKHVFPLPLPHTAGVFLLMIKGHPITFLPAQFCAYVLPLLQPRLPCGAAGETASLSVDAALFTTGAAPKRHRDVRLDVPTGFKHFVSVFRTCRRALQFVAHMHGHLPLAPCESFWFVFFLLELYAGTVYRHSVRYAKGNKKLFWMFTTFCYACCVWIKGYVCSMSVQSFKHTSI